LIIGGTKLKCWIGFGPTIDSIRIAAGERMDFNFIVVEAVVVVVGVVAVAGTRTPYI